MNSDFMQAEVGGTGQAGGGEPDNRSRIKKVYLLVYGRDPSEQEIKLGLDYLHAEPMREYEENKNKPPEGGRGGRGGRGGPGGPPTMTSDAAKPETQQGAVAAGGDAPAADLAAGGAAEATPMGMGMMGGMGGFGAFGGGAGGRRGGAPAAPTTVKYEPTAWGRYVKVLFSSSEFLFIN